MSNTGQGQSRLRIRGIETGTDKKIVSRQNCLAVPHIGEALDRFAGHAFFGQFGLDVARELHHGHGLPLPGKTADCGPRCVVVDAVAVDEPIGEDEVKVQ